MKSLFEEERIRRRKALLPRIISACFEESPRFARKDAGADGGVSVRTRVPQKSEAMKSLFEEERIRRRKALPPRIISACVEEIPRFARNDAQADGSAYPFEPTSLRANGGISVRTRVTQSEQSERRVSSKEGGPEKVGDCPFAHPQYTNRVRSPCQTLPPCYL